MTTIEFRHERPKGSFDAKYLPDAEKEQLVRGLLEEFDLPVSQHIAQRHELVIPCTLGDHRNQGHDPTGAINYHKLVFKCLGCQRSGGLLWFIAQYREGSEDDARKWLAKEAGLDGTVQDLQALLKYFDALYADKPERQPIPTYPEKILEPWMLLHPWVTDPIADGGRGIPEQTALDFKIGYAEEFPYSKNRVSERIVIPHFWKGKLVGWQSRRLTASDGTAKYKSSDGFPKDTTIYNYAPEKHRDAIVVESPASVLRHEHHQHLVATFGANITDRQVKLLGRYDRLYFWLDNDNAGWNAYKGINKDDPGVLDQCSAITDVWVIDSPFHADPADLDDEMVDHLKATAVPWVIWEIPKVLICHRCGANAHTGGCA